MTTLCLKDPCNDPECRLDHEADHLIDEPWPNAAEVGFYLQEFEQAEQEAIREYWREKSVL